MRRASGGTRVALCRASLVLAACLLATACVHPPPPGPHAGAQGGGRAAASSVFVELGPEHATAPVASRHLLVATLRDDGGRPVGDADVAWVLVAGSDGAFDTVDGGDGSRATAATGLRSVTTRTARLPYELHVDGRIVPIAVGQTWCLLRSDTEGETDVLAYVPGNPDRLWGEVRVRRTWVDAVWDWPLDAESSAGTAHTLATRVVRASDGAPLEGYPVSYEIVGGDAAAWFADGSTRAQAVTDKTGVAVATLKEAGSEPGRSQVRVTLAEPPREDGSAGRVLAEHVVTKTWTDR